MKIAELVATFPPYHGGMGYVCYHNALALARRGHDVTVFSLDHKRLDHGCDPQEFKVVRLRTPLLYGDAGAVPQLFFLLRDFDIIHLHYPFFGGAEYVLLASVLQGRKYFLTFHMDVIGNTLVKDMILKCYDPTLARLVMKKASRIGALSVEHLTNSKFSPYIDRSKVDVIPNGVDVLRFSPGEKDEKLLAQYGLSGKTVVLFVGNLLAVKGLHFLINAIAGLNDRRISLLIVGGGYDEEVYRRQVKELHLEDQVIFAGPKSPEVDLPAHYRLGDFLVLPSTSESFGLVVLEAMATGIPAIVSNLPGPSQLVEDGTDGLIAGIGDEGDWKEKIAMLASQPGRRREMGAAARTKVVEKYSWAEAGERLESAFARIVSER